jgi:ATP-binding protein involved in chromosome partitioning
MNTITTELVTEALSTVREPELGRDLVSLGFVKDIRIEGRDVSFTIMLTTPACPLKTVMREDCERALRERIPDIGRIEISFDSRVNADRRIAEKLNLPIRNIIAVSSGKGGVGKTTVSVNLAAALALEGASVGLLDADIYGPNVPVMMGLSEQTMQQDGKILPHLAHGVKVMSMGVLIPRNQALVWRGPMLHSVMKQLLEDVAWGELDYLVVDLPPGTGDAQLSLAQLVPLTCGIIVTGPQAVSLEDAYRGIDAFNRLEVPVLGIVENMAGEIFGSGGGERAAEELSLPFLGRVELDAAVRKSGDEGEPIVVRAPESSQAQAFRTLARVTAGRVSMLTFEQA